MAIGLNCINPNNPEHKKLQEILGEDKASNFILHNAGNSITQTKEGKQSKFFEDVKNNFSEKDAYNYKHRITEPDFLKYFGGKVDENGEPLISNIKTRDELNTVLSQKVSWEDRVSQIVSDEEGVQTFKYITFDMFNDFVEGVSHNILQQFMENQNKTITVGSLFKSQLEDFNQTIQGLSEEDALPYKELISPENWRMVEKNVLNILKTRYGIKLTKAAKANQEEVVSDRVEEKFDDTDANVKEDSLQEEMEGDKGTSRDSFEDAAFEMDPQDSASFRIKSIIGQIPIIEGKDADGNYIPKVNWTGLPMYQDPSEIYYSLLSDIAGKNMTVSELKEFLSNHNNPHYNYIVDLIEDRPSKYQVWNEFTKVVNKTALPFKVFIHKINNFEGSKTIDFKIFDSNRNTKANNAMAVLEMDFVMTMFYEEDSALKYRADLSKSVGQNIEKLLKDFRESKATDKVETFNKELSTELNKLGLNISYESLQELANNFSKYTGVLRYTADLNDNKGIFSKIAEELMKEDVTPDKHLFTQVSETLRKISGAVAETNNTFFPKSFKNIDNNVIYAFTDNFHLFREYHKIKNNEEYVNKLRELSYSGKSYYLDRIQRDPNFKKAFEVIFIDGIRNSQEGSTGMGVKSITDEELEVMSLSGYMNGGKDEMYLLNPIASDKPKVTMTKILRIKNLLSDIKLMSLETGALKLGENSMLIHQMQNLFDAEYDRIYKSTELGNTGNSQYDTGKKIFFMFPIFNYSILKEAVGTSEEVASRKAMITQEEFDILYDENGVMTSFVDNLPAIEIRHKIFERILSNLMMKKVGVWRDLGLIDASNNLIKDATFVKSDKSPFLSISQKAEILGGTSTKETPEDTKEVIAKKKMLLNALTTRLLALDMEFHTVLNQANYQMLFGGDFALHTKYKKTDLHLQSAEVLKKVISDTINEATKRAAKDVAPSSRPGTMIYDVETKSWIEERPTYNSLTASDVSVQLSSEYIRSNKRLNAIFSKGDATDAQELTSPLEHIDNMFKEGKISDELYTTLKSKAFHQKGKLLKDIPKQYLFTEEELKAVLKEAEGFKPTKPVYVGKHINYSKDVAEEVYIKSSTMALFAQQFGGTDFDKIRVFMETNNIDRIPFTTAVKLGAKTPARLFDANGRFRDDIKPEEFKESIMSLNREDLGIQQEIPSHDEVPVITQLNNNIFEGLEEKDFIEEGFQLGAESKYSKKHTLQEFKQIKEDIRKKLFDLHLGALKKEVANPDGSLNMPKLEGKIKAELESRGLEDYGKMIKVVNGEFETPLPFLAISEKVEALLISMFKKVISQQTPGFSMPQGSSVPIKGFETGMSNAGIVWIGNKNPEEGLRYMDIKEGKTMYAEIVLPWRFKDQNGNSINMNKFIGSNGRIDMDKIPAKILKIITARIPNQGYVSDLPVRIVGFFQPGFNDLVLVPQEIVAQMGSDFDVDKLYGYMYNIWYSGSKIEEYSPLISKEGSVDFTLLKQSTAEDNEDFAREAQIKQLQNLYLDILKGVLMHPKVAPKVMRPLDMDDLKNEKSILVASEADIITDLRGNKVIERFVNNSEGRTGVGIAANALKLNNYLQGKDISVNIGIEVEGMSSPLTQLGGMGKTSYNGEIRTKSDNINIFANEAVDNAKNVVLGALKLNQVTSPIATSLAMLNSENNEILSIDYITRLINQPIVQYYIKELSSAKGTIKELNGKRSNKSKSKLASNTYAKIYRMYEKDLKDYTIKPKIYSPSTMKDDILNPTKGVEYTRRQFDMLNAFIRAMQLSDGLTSFVTTLSTNPGKNMIELYNKQRNYKDYSSSNKIVLDYGTKTKPEFNITGLSQVLFNGEEDTEVGAMVKVFYGGEDTFSAYSKLGDLFPYKEDFFDRMITFVEQFKETGKLTNREASDIWNNMKSFYLQRADNPLALNGSLLRKKYYESDKLFNELKRLKEQFPDNRLLQRLTIDVSKKHNDKKLTTISYYTTIAKPGDDVENKKLFNALLTNDYTKQFAIDLVKYIFATGATRTSARLMRILPTSLLTDPDFTEMLRGYKNFFKRNDINLDRFKTQYLQHSPRLIPESTVEASNKELSDIYTKVKNGSITNFTLSEVDILNIEGIAEQTKYGVVAKDFTKIGNKLVKIEVNSVGDYVFSVIPFVYDKSGVKFYNPSKSLAEPITLVETVTEEPKKIEKKAKKEKPVKKEVPTSNITSQEEDKNIPSKVKEEVEEPTITDDDPDEIYSQKNASPGLEGEIANQKINPDNNTLPKNINKNVAIDVVEIPESINIQMNKDLLDVAKTFNNSSKSAFVTKLEQYISDNNVALSDFERRQLQKISQFAKNSDFFDKTTILPMDSVTYKNKYDREGTMPAFYDIDNNKMIFDINRFDMHKFLHEMEHVITRNVAQFYLDNKINRNLSPDKAELVYTIARIDNIRKTVIDNVLQDENKRKSLIAYMKASKGLSSLDKSLDSRLKKEFPEEYNSVTNSDVTNNLYGLVSITEFFAELQSNPSFVKELSEHSYQEANVIDKLLQYLKNMYKILVDNIFDTDAYTAADTLATKLAKDLLEGKFGDSFSSKQGMKHLPDVPVTQQVRMQEMWNNTITNLELQHGFAKVSNGKYIYNKFEDAPIPFIRATREAKTYNDSNPRSVYKAFVKEDNSIQIERVQNVDKVVDIQEINDNFANILNSPKLVRRTEELKNRCK